jgi:hypothetical protein
VRAAIVSVLVGLAATAVASPALADKRTEAAAKSAMKKAQNDYLAMNYGSGAARLQKAIHACGTTKCSPGVQAALLVDEGAMLFRVGTKDDAAKAWAQAAKLKPGLALNPAYDAPDLRAAFTSAVGGGGGGGGEGGAPTSGDFTHTPPTEQATDTPLPIYVEGGGDGIVRVVVKYKSDTGTSWRRVDLKKLGSGWGGLIPCVDVTTGTLHYYIQGFDASHTPVASNGDQKHTYSVPIRGAIASDAPHLPGKQAPKSCSESSDCPPDFPGCSKSGEAADDNGEGDEDENRDEEAKEKKPSGFKRFWVGLGVEQEFVSVPSGTDLCVLDGVSALPANSHNMYCTAQNGTDFPQRSPQGAAQNAAVCSPASPPGTCPGDAGGTSGGGVVPGDLRLMASFDYAFTANLMAGARVGATFFKYEGQNAVTDNRAFGSRLYADVRGTWVFGQDALAQKGFKPIVQAGFGIGAVDGHTSSFIGLCAPNGQSLGSDGQSTNTAAMGQCKSGSQPNYTKPQGGTVYIWEVNGPFFMLVAGGVRWAITDSIAFTGLVRVNFSFGNSGLLPTFGPEIGAAYGF